MNENQVLSAYAAYSYKEQERLNSSSGGVFSLLATDILADGGIVYGVAMSENCQNAEFIRVSDEKELDRLRTSKYLQARVGSIFNSVKEDLEKGMVVLFSGTGCQVNGLIGFLSGGQGSVFVRSQYPNLFCLDIICHGVPSPALWRKYVKYIEKKHGAKLKSINFRCKDDSWTDFGMKEYHEIKGEDEAYQKEIYISKDKDPYMLMFLRDYCLRPSCYACKAKETKLSDITMADFWKINEIAPEMSDGKGTSLVLVRTEKGTNLFARIQKNLRVKEVSYSEGVSGNKAEYQSALRPIQRDVFFNDMNALSFEELEKKYGMPLRISLRRKIKREVKKILIKYKIIGGGYKIKHSSGYYMHFVLRTDSEK